MHSSLSGCFERQHCTQASNEVFYSIKVFIRVFQEAETLGGVYYLGRQDETTSLIRDLRVH